MIYVPSSMLALDVSLQTMVNQKNKQTFSPDLVGEDCILASLERLINSKVYHKQPRRKR